MSRPHGRWRRHLPALVLFLGLSAFLFRLTLFHGYRFIGNADRWNHYLSFAKFHGDNLARGHFSAWSDYLFTGFDTLSLPFSFVSPLFALPVLLGSADIVKVLGYVSPVLLASTLFVAYLVLHSLCHDRLAAAASALIYGLSTWSLLKLSQNDNSYLSVVAAPILFWLIHTSRPSNLGRRIAVTTTVVWICIYWSFLQYFSYAGLMLLAYSVFRATRRAWAPVTVFAVSFTLATTLGIPRLLQLRETIMASSRTGGGVVELVSPELFLRYLDGNIFARSYRELMEAHDMRLSSLNLSEGNLLFTSIFASLLLLCALLRTRSRVVAPADVTASVPSGFFAVFIVVVFLVIHYPPFYDLFSMLYGRVSFLHTRFAFAALFPIALVSSLALARAPDWRPTPRRVAVVALIALAILAVDGLDYDRLKAPVLAWLHKPPGVFLKTRRLANPIVAAEALRFVLVSTCFAALLLARRPFGWLDQGTFRSVVAVVIIAQSALFADHFLSGPHTREYTMPFEALDPVLARPDEFRPPTIAEQREMSGVLDNDAFRSLLICPRDLIPIDCSSAVGMMWRIRLVDGYLSGISTRYISLPWPDGSSEIRAIRFSRLSAAEPPQTAGVESAWRLFSLLNVRNAVVVTRSFYTNSHFRPSDLAFVVNPSRYIYPRVYFARATRAVSRPEAVAAIRRHFSPCRPGPDCSPQLEAKHPFDYVEGLPHDESFEDSAPITARFLGDRIELEFAASGRRRFLVINEAYDARWQATANGRRLDIHPTNVVMRGIPVPPGTTGITLEYRSVLADTVRLLAVALPLLGLAALLVLSPRYVRSRRSVRAATPPA